MLLWHVICKYMEENLVLGSNIVLIYTINIPKIIKIRSTVYIRGSSKLFHSLNKTMPMPTAVVTVHIREKAVHGIKFLVVL